MNLLEMKVFSDTRGGEVLLGAAVSGGPIRAQVLVCG